MVDKQAVLTLLRDELEQWETLLATLTDSQISALRPGGDMTIKDSIAHLKTWGEISIARMEAAAAGTVPVYPGWPDGLDPDADDLTDRLNEWILDTHRDRPWADVHREWREGYLRLIALGEGFSEDALLERDKYPWMEEHSLMAVLQGSYEHHHDEHLEPLRAWLRENGNGTGR